MLLVIVRGNGVNTSTGSLSTCVGLLSVTFVACSGA
jgi:hypothetical protein